MPETAPAAEWCATSADAAAAPAHATATPSPEHAGGLLGYLLDLFKETDFMPHGHCYLWNEGTLWLNVGADSLIALAYFAIPFSLFYFARRRKDFSYRWLLLLFAAFILLCGMTHVMAVVNMWVPYYRFDGVLKLATGLVSAATAVALWRILPAALALPSPAAFRRSQEERMHEARERARAEASSQFKSEFLANMSHEIRTPLNGLTGMLEVLRDTPLNKEQKECVEIARTSSEQLLGLINDILDLSKIEAGKVELARASFDVRESVRGAVELMRSSAEAKGLDLLCRVDESVPAWLRGDPLRLRQILTNLLSNAVKFTHVGRVLVRVELDEETAPAGRCRLRVSVEDSGVGIRADQIEKIFEAFRQEDATIAQQYGGTGLGLTISQNLATLMGGSLSVQSEPGEGSTFTARLVLETVGEEEATRLVYSRENESGPDGETTANGKSILVAEDNESNRKVAGMILRGEGFDVRFAHNGEAALRLLAEESFALVLLDLRMPGLDGLEVVRRLRKSPPGHPNREVPVVALTAQALQEDRERCLLAGMDHFLSKPYTRKQLLAVVNPLLRG